MHTISFYHNDVYMLEHLGLKNMSFGLVPMKELNVETLGVKKHVDPDTRFLATIANEAYRNEVERPQLIGEYEYDTQLSGKKTAVYVDRKRKKAVVSHRGTEISDPSDLRSDFLGVFLGGRDQDPQFAGANVRTLSVKNKYKGYDITATGHSLGGTLANYSAEKNRIRSVTFNPGAGLPEIFAPTWGETNRTITDPVSLLARGKVKQYRAKNGAHDLSNFL